MPLEGYRQWRDDCYGTDTTGLNGVDSTAVYRHCAHRAGVGVPRGMRQRGDLAERLVLRGASEVVYVPNVGFTGAEKTGPDTPPTGLSKYSDDFKPQIRRFLPTHGRTNGQTDGLSR